jgi:L-lactate dehydrogenase
MTAIGLVGAGAVGQAFGSLVTVAPWCERFLITSRTREKAEALSTDLQDQQAVLGITASSAASDIAGLVESCDAIVIAVRAPFVNVNRTDVRTGGLAANAPIIASLADQMRGYCGVILMVTNPVDILSRLFAERSMCPTIFGIGSNLDSARYRIVLAHVMKVPLTAVSGHVIGEHGDAAVICTSSTTVYGRSVTVPLSQVRRAMDRRPREIGEGIKRVRAGAAGAIVSALCKILGLNDGIEELSMRQDGGCWSGLPLRFTGGDAEVDMSLVSVQESKLFQLANDRLNARYRHLSQYLLPRSSNQ